MRTGQTAVPFLGAEASAARVHANAELVSFAAPHLRWLGTAVAHLPFHCVMLTDADGVIVDSTGNLPSVMDQFGLRPGYEWSEKAMGTNGIGTALAAGRPVAVVGDEHFLEIIHNYTCVGAPIRSPDGRSIGALDLCTTASDGDPTRLVLVAYAAQTIGKELASRAQALDLVKDHAALLVHEILTPLTSLSVVARRLYRASADAPATRDLANRFEKQLRRLELLTTGLLEATRPAESTWESAPAITLGALLEEVVADFGDAAEKTGRPLRVHGDTSLVARWDRRKLQQIANNLIGNAYKHGLRGPIDVRIEVADDAERRTLRLSVSDDGPGLRTEERALVFERGARGQRAAELPGKGLGLWIVAELVQSLGGTIEVTSEPGRGATFVVTLPLPA